MTQEPCNTRQVDDGVIETQECQVTKLLQAIEVIRCAVGQEYGYNIVIETQARQYVAWAEIS